MKQEDRQIMDEILTIIRDELKQLVTERVGDLFRDEFKRFYPWAVGYHRGQHREGPREARRRGLGVCGRRRSESCPTPMEKGPTQGRGAARDARRIPESCQHRAKKLRQDPAAVLFGSGYRVQGKCRSFDRAPKLISKREHSLTIRLTAFAGCVAQSGKSPMLKNHCQAHLRVLLTR